MRFLALIMNIALTLFFIGVIVDFADGRWDLRSYVSVFFIFGATMINIVYLFWMTRQPWFSFRRAHVSGTTATTPDILLPESLRGKAPDSASE